MGVNEPYECMFCGEEIEPEDGIYPCEACNTLWVANNLAVSRDVKAYTDRRNRERQAYRRYEQWVNAKPLHERILWKLRNTF